MAGWDYIVGETGYDRPFNFWDKGTNLGFNGTGVSTVTMTILKSDLTAVTPTAISNVALTVTQVNPLKASLAVVAATPNVPQVPASYIVQFTITIGAEIRKTFELDLRVYNG